MEKKYRIMLTAYISIDDVERMINWADQGWKADMNCEYHSMMIHVNKEIKVQTNRIELYVQAIEQLGNDIHVEWYEEIK